MPSEALPIAVRRHPAWNKGRIVGQKHPLAPKSGRSGSGLRRPIAGPIQHGKSTASFGVVILLASRYVMEDQARVAIAPDLLMSGVIAQRPNQPQGIDVSL